MSPHKTRDEGGDKGARLQRWGVLIAAAVETPFVSAMLQEKTPRQPNGYCALRRRQRARHGAGKHVISELRRAAQRAELRRSPHSLLPGAVWIDPTGRRGERPALSSLHEPLLVGAALIRPVPILVAARLPSAVELHLRRKALVAAAPVGMCVKTGRRHVLLVGIIGPHLGVCRNRATDRTTGHQRDDGTRYSGDDRASALQGRAHRTRMKVWSSP